MSDFSTNVQAPTGTIVATRSSASIFVLSTPLIIKICAVWVALVLLIALSADLIAPHSYSQLDLLARLTPPVFFGGSTTHWLGTDELGRDVLSRLIFSVRISLLVAFISTLLSAVVGVLMGFAAAHFRGWVEQLVLTLVDFQASMPFMIIALAVLAFLGTPCHCSSL